MAVCGTSHTVGALIAYGYRSVTGWVHTVHLLSNLWPSPYTVHSPTGYMDILILNTYSARPLPLHDNSMSNTLVVVVEGDNSSTTSHCKEIPCAFLTLKRQEHVSKTWLPTAKLQHLLPFSLRRLFRYQHCYGQYYLIC